MKSTVRTRFAALILPACAALTLLASAPSADAAGYLKLGDIKGEATDANHQDWIIIDSMSAPIFRALTTDPATGAQRRRGDVILDDLSCTKILDKASPKIAEALCNGTVYPEVEIHLCVTVDNGDGTTRQQPYLKYRLVDVMISSYSISGSASGDPLPTEEITLGYTEVEWTYVILDPAKNPTGEVTGYSVGAGAGA